MNICFIDRLGSPYDGSTPFKRALGGSESAVVYAALELAKLGHDVTVYNDCEGLDAKSGLYDGVNYRPYSSIDLFSDWYDVAIVSRSTQPFTGFVAATHKVLWMHDTFCEGDDQLEALVVQGKIDELWTLSDWHTTYISQCTHGHRRMMEVLKRKIWVTRNGVNIWRDVDITNKDYNKFVFNAAVSKGMETLLNDVWPRVKERIPKAILTVIGGAYPLSTADVQNDKLIELIKLHENKNDVIFTNLITQKMVANHIANAGFMIYPQSFPETYGISTVESLVYATPVISGRFGAMEETAIDEACYLMDYPVDSNVLYTFNKENHVAHFVEMVVSAHTNKYLWQQKANAALRVREVCEWDKVILQWQQHLYKKLGLYLPKEDYLKVQRINHRTHEIFNKRWSNPEEWAFYPEKEKSLQVVVPFYNASQYLRKCIESIASQNYENYTLHLVDDGSDDDSVETCTQALSDFNILDKAFQYKAGEKRVGALANQIRIIKEMLKDDIIVLIDGDDALNNDNNIFKKINQLYHDGAEMTYGSMWSMADNIPLVAQEYPREVHEKGSYRKYKFPWNIPYTHLRTFSLKLFGSIDENDLKDRNGDYYKAGGDSALFYALIEKADPTGIRAVRDILYLYNDAHSNNDYKINSKEQTKNANEILAKNPKFDMSRVDRFIWTSTNGLRINNTGRSGPPIFKNRNKKSILIAIPTAKNICADTFKSIYEQYIPKGYSVYYQHFYGYCIDQVRNLIAHYAISNGFDYLFCVDYDISFPSDTLAKLLAHDKSIVTGLYIQRIPGEHNLELYRRMPNGGHLRLTLDSLVGALEPIDGCGLGCCLIKTEVLKEVGYPQFTYHHALEMKDTLSEDVDFCNKARDKGFDIWADTTITCRHHGDIIYKVDTDNNG
jgi:glycosyltransferase involved in cell wall biosynthesis